MGKTKSVLITFAIITISSGICLAENVYSRPENDFKFRCPVSDGLYSSNGCSRHYLECRSQRALLATCTQYLVFNPMLGACDSRTNVPECQTRMLVNDNVFICPGDGFYPTSGECTANYFVCFSGDAYLESCPQGYVFDSIAKRCVQEASCRSYACESNGYFPNAGSCSKFWICVDGTSYPGECPPGLIFDPDQSKCVVAQNDQTC